MTERERLDGVDVANVIEATQSPGYRLIADRIRKIGESKLRELRNTKLSNDETQAVRGFLDGLDRCLAVPEQIRQEWEARKGRDD